MEEEEEGEDRLWAIMTAECLSQCPARLPATKRLVVLGDDEAQKCALVARLRGAAPAAAEAEPRSGNGLRYGSLTVRDELLEQQARLGAWVLDDAPRLAPALLPYAVGESPADATVLLLGSMTAPWGIREAVERWAALLREHLAARPGERRRRPRAYVEGPGAGPCGGPPEEGEEVEVVVVVTRTEHMRVLESDFGYEARHFDFLQVALRRLCLRLGASLFYVSLREDRNCDLLLKYLLHRVYAFPFRVPPALLLERDSVFVPSGWDSEAKIRVLEESLGPAATPYEEVLYRPGSARDRPLHVEVSAQADQEFLLALQGALSRAEADQAPAPDSRTELVGAVQRAGPSRRPRPAPPIKSQPAAAVVPGNGDTILHTFFKNLLDKRRSLPTDRPDGLGGRRTYDDDDEDDPENGDDPQKRRFQRSISQAHGSSSAASRFDAQAEDPLEEQADETHDSKVQQLPEYFVMSGYGQSCAEDSSEEERASHATDREEIPALDIKHKCKDSSS